MPKNTPRPVAEAEPGTLDALREKMAPNTLTDGVSAAALGAASRDESGFADSSSDPAQARIVDAAAGQLVREARAATEVMTQEDLLETARVNQMIGIATYARALDSVNKVTMLKALQRIKDSKSYKDMVIPGPDGGIIRPKNFAELCAAIGMSRSKVDEDLENLSYFGGKLIEEQKSLGIGYRDLRALRAGMADLPEAKRQEVQDIIAAAAASGDKEEILATLEELGARNAKMAAELNSAKKTLKAKDALQAKTTEKVNTLEIQLEQALNPGSEDERQQNLADARDVFRNRLDGVCNALVGSTTSMCNYIANTRKADTEGTPLGEAIVDAELWEHINARVMLTFDSIRSLCLDAGLDVDSEMFPEVVDPDAPEIETDQDHPQQ